MNEFPDGDFSSVVIWSDNCAGTGELNNQETVDFKYVGDGKFEVRFPDKLRSKLFPNEGQQQQVVVFSRQGPRELSYQDLVLERPFMCTIRLKVMLTMTFVVGYYYLGIPGDNQSGGWGGGW